MGRSQIRSSGAFRETATNNEGDAFVVGTPVIQANSKFGQVAVSAAVELKLTVTPRRSLTIITPTAIYIGSTNAVTTANGCLIPANVPVTLNFDPDVFVSVFAVASAATQVSLIEA